MNTYSSSFGRRFTQKEIENRMRKAKKTVLKNQILELGYNVCTKCYRNDCKPIDCSHIISVQEAKNTGRVELCWDIDNIRPLGRKCHQKHDLLNLKFTKTKTI